MASATENSSDVPKNSDEPKINGSERAGSPIATEKVSFDDRGDLTLRVGSLEDGGADVFEFVVCSRALARASPVFRAMLFGGFSESKPEGDTWIVKLPEDRPAPFFILLNIIHGRFRAVPQKLKLDELYQLLVVTNKYDMLSVIFQWAPSWFEPFKTLEASIEGNERLLWIAWELGDKGAFELMSRNLVLGSGIDNEGRLIDKKGVPLNTYDCYEATDILDSITKARQNLVNDLNGLFHNAIRKALKNRGCIRKEKPKVSTSSQAVVGHSSPSVPATQDWTAIKARCNNATLFEGMKTVEVLGLGKFGLLQDGRIPFLGQVIILWTRLSIMRPDYRVVHEECSPLAYITARFEASINGFSLPILENHLNYMRSQAGKTAIGGYGPAETGEPRTKKPKI